MVTKSSSHSFYFKQKWLVDGYAGLVDFYSIQVGYKGYKGARYYDDIVLYSLFLFPAEVACGR